MGSVSVNVEHVQSLYMELELLKGSSDVGRIKELGLQIAAATEALTSSEKPVLTALKSNNLVFNIFSYFPQPKAQILLRSLCRKGLEKSQFLH